MKAEADDAIHTVYGARLNGSVVYVGCTSNFKSRKRELIASHPKFKRYRRKIGFVVLGRRYGIRSAKTLETQLISRFKEAGQCSWNVCPSVTLAWGLNNLKSQWATPRWSVKKRIAYEMMHGKSRREELKGVKRVLTLVCGYLSTQPQALALAWNGGVMTLGELRRHIKAALTTKALKAIGA